MAISCISWLLKLKWNKLKYYQDISSVENLLCFELIEHIRNLYNFDDVDPLDGISSHQWQLTI